MSSPPASSHVCPRCNHGLSSRRQLFRHMFARTCHTHQRRQLHTKDQQQRQAGDITSDARPSNIISTALPARPRESLLEQFLTSPHRDDPIPAGSRTSSRLSQLRALTILRYNNNNTPPQPRQPDPYPEGEVIYRCNNRVVVRHGDTVTKYTTNPYGMGINDHPNEALALAYVRDHTTIPVPEVLSSAWDRITMTYVPGEPPSEAWTELTPAQRSGILAQLKDYISQMSCKTGDSIRRLSGEGIVVPSIIERTGGPFETVKELHRWLVRPSTRMQAQSMYWEQITSHLGEESPIVFTHGDIAARNILVREGRIVALLDWEFAGWLPAYWEYVFALRGLDNIDWGNLGRHLPDLFPRRYDLEYILLRFIVSLS